MATQNPIETEGTYPLPEAQVDRFMMKVLIGYPTEEEEYVIVERVTGAAVQAAAVATTEQLIALQRECRKTYVDPGLMQYAVKLVSATRDPARYGMADLSALHHLWRQPPRNNQHDRGLTCARLPQRARLRSSRRCHRPGSGHS